MYIAQHADMVVGPNPISKYMYMPCAEQTWILWGECEPRYPSKKEENNPCI